MTTETKKHRGRPFGKHPENWKRHTPYVTVSISGKPEEIQHLKETAAAAGKTVSRYVLDKEAFELKEI